MTSTPPPSSDASSHSESHHPFDNTQGRAVETDYDPYEGIDLRDVFARLARGFAQTLGLAALGLVIAAVIYLVASPSVTTTTTSRVIFAFDGFANGEYPDHTKFQPDDLRAPDVVIEALNRQKLGASEESQSKIRSALTIEGIIPPYVIKERDRLRAAGQAVPSYVPDEYQITLTLPRKFPLTSQQRALMLNEIVTVYREKFLRTYGALPLAFGNVEETLRDADLFEYEFILNAEAQSIYAYLNQQIEKAKSFRSPTTNLAFSDLLKQAQLFDQIELNETLGRIRLNNLSRDRNAALIKMDYTLKTLADRERTASEEEKTTREFLEKAEEHARNQNYVLGVKSQATQARTETPVLDQGLVDSLLANDSYSVMIRKALDASLLVKRIQAEEARILERRKEMDAAIRDGNSDQSMLIKQVEASIKVMEEAYDRLIANIRKTHADYAAQQYADAIRISMQPVTDSKYRPLAVAGIIGGFLGLALGMGLSLMGVYVGGAKRG